TLALAAVGKEGVLSPDGVPVAVDRLHDQRVHPVTGKAEFIHRAAEYVLLRVVGGEGVCDVLLRAGRVGWPPVPRGELVQFVTGGERVTRVADPDGHVLEIFGGGVGHLTVDT